MLQKLKDTLEVRVQRFEKSNGETSNVLQLLRNSGQICTVRGHRQLTHPTPNSICDAQTQVLRCPDVSHDFLCLEVELFTKADGLVQALVLR